MEKKIYDTRVIPLVRYEKNEKNGKEVVIDNLTVEERNNMSCAPRMLRENREHVYIAEMPLAFRGSGILGSLYYVFDELTKEEQERFFDRSIIIPTTIEKVVEVYDVSSKRIFSKKRTKQRK